MAKYAFRDYGGDSRGGWQPRCKSTWAVCPSCGQRQLISKLAWSRRSRPMCAACGALLEPNKTYAAAHCLATKRPDAVERHCALCGKKLSASNQDDVCYLCQRVEVPDHDPA